MHPCPLWHSGRCTHVFPSKKFCRAMTVTYQLSDYIDYRKQSRVVKASGLSIRSWLTRQNEDSVDPWWKTCHIFTYGSTLTKDTDTLSKRKRNFPDGLAKYVIHSAFAVELQLPSANLYTCVSRKLLLEWWIYHPTYGANLASNTTVKIENASEFSSRIGKSMTGLLH